MIELRLHPPFTVADLAGFSRLAASFDPDAEVGVDDDCLYVDAPTPDEWPRLDRGVVALVQEQPATPVAAPEREAERVPPAVRFVPASADEQVRAAVDRTIAAMQPVKPATRRAGEINTDAGTVAGQILRTLAAERGMWEDSLSELAREAWPASLASVHPTARTLEKAGLIRCRREGRSVVAVELLAAGWDALGDDAARYRGAPRGSAPTPDVPGNTPAVTDLGSIEGRPFDPDQLRSQAAGAL